MTHQEKQGCCEKCRVVQTRTNKTLGYSSSWVECTNPACPCHSAETPYNQLDHVHCWESKKPPCGQKIEHLKCCLCELRNPKATTGTDIAHDIGQSIKHQLNRQTAEKQWNGAPMLEPVVVPTTDTVENECSCGSPRKEGWKHSTTVCGGLSFSSPTTDTSDWLARLKKMITGWKGDEGIEYDGEEMEAFIEKEIERARTEGYEIRTKVDFEAGQQAMLAKVQEVVAAEERLTGEMPDHECGSAGYCSHYPVLDVRRVLLKSLSSQLEKLREQR